MNFAEPEKARVVQGLEVEKAVVQK